MPSLWWKGGEDSTLQEQLECNGAAGGGSNANYAKMVDPKNSSVALGGRSSPDYAEMDDPKNSSVALGRAAAKHLPVASKQVGGNTLMASRSPQQSEQQLQHQYQTACDDYQRKLKQLSATQKQLSATQDQLSATQDQLSATQDKLVESLSQENKRLTGHPREHAAANYRAKSPSMVEGPEQSTQQVEADRDAVTAARDVVTAARDAVAAADRECEAAEITKDDLQSQLHEAQLKSSIAAAEQGLRAKAGRWMGGR